MILYNLRTDGSGAHRITKFVDGEAESSYIVSPRTCECPAGHRSTCRHRQMLPELLARNLLDYALFWDFERKQTCDMNGLPMRHTIEKT